MAPSEKLLQIASKLSCTFQASQRTVAAKLLRTQLTNGAVTPLELIEANTIPPLLNMAQTPTRKRDFSIATSTPPDIAAQADAALLLLGDLASHATDLLATEGWEVVDDGAGRAQYVHQETGETRRDPPSLGALRSGGTKWCGTLLLELPIVVAPFVSGGEGGEEGEGEGRLVWPAHVWWHEISRGGEYLTVIDLLEEDEEQGEDSTMRVLVSGPWQGMGGPREAEMDVGYPPGSHLENWHSVTLAGLTLLSSGGSGRVLHLGLGGGIIPSFLRRHAPSLDIRCVESNEAIVSIAQKWFGFSSTPSSTPTQPTPAHPPLPPCTLQITDTSKYLSTSQSQSFPTVVVNITTNNTFPSHLLTLDFFRELHRVLDTSTSMSLVLVNAGTGPEKDRVASFMRVIFPFTRTLFDPKGGEDEDEPTIIVGAVDEAAVTNINVGQWRSVVAEIRKAGGGAERVPFVLEDVRGTEGGDVVGVKWGGNWEDDEVGGEDGEEEVPTLVSLESKPQPLATRPAKDDPVWGLFD
ncbi:hypothetical protein HDV00_007385 [Rhizophlyctis rosea]|nr:hypothetical protein HDV00_007385 [Rhizophlyctis rosea]